MAVSNETNAQGGAGAGAPPGGPGGGAPGRVRLPGVSSRAYEHPADRSALVALRRLRGFDTVFKALSGLLPERSLRLLFLSDSVRVDRRQFAHLHALLRDACDVLDLEKVPAMYVAQDPRPNAMCIGMDEPIIVLTTGLVDLLDDDELRAVVGHEVGHAMSGHAVYRTILLFLTNLAVRVAWIPLGAVALMAITNGLREWFRKSELSADRAGLLAGQDLAASLRGLMKVAGGNHLQQMDVDAFLDQAAEYEAAGDLRDSVVKILNVLPRTHPFAAVRAAELKRWAEGGDYQRIVDGTYPLRREDPDTSVYESLKASATHYAETVRASRDPLMRLIGDLSAGAGDLGGRLRERIVGATGPLAAAPGDRDDALPAGPFGDDGPEDLMAGPFGDDQPVEPLGEASPDAAPGEPLGDAAPGEAPPDAAPGEAAPRDAARVEPPPEAPAPDAPTPDAVHGAPPDDAPTPDAVHGAPPDDAPIRDGANPS